MADTKKPTNRQGKQLAFYVPADFYERMSRAEDIYKQKTGLTIRHVDIMRIGATMYLDKLEKELGIAQEEK